MQKMQDFVSTKTCFPKPNYEDYKNVELNALRPWEHITCKLHKTLVTITRSTISPFANYWLVCLSASWGHIGMSCTKSFPILGEKNEMSLIIYQAN